jgi:hypothetical protein
MVKGMPLTSDPNKNLEIIHFDLIVSEAKSFIDSAYEKVRYPSVIQGNPKALGDLECDLETALANVRKALTIVIEKLENTNGE